MRVLKLDISGIPEAWITPEDAAAYYATESVAYTLGDPMLALRGGTNRHGRQSRIEIHPILAVNGASAAGVLLAATPRLTRFNHKLFARDRHVCAYCGGTFDAAQLTREHVVPLAQGGADRWMNVVTADRSCNQRKANRTPEQARMPLLYLPYVPCRWEDMILQARHGRILADQMAFLKSGLPSRSRLNG